MIANDECYLVIAIHIPGLTNGVRRRKGRVVVTSRLLCLYCTKLTRTILESVKCFQKGQE